MLSELLGFIECHAMTGKTKFCTITSSIEIEAEHVQRFRFQNDNCMSRKQWKFRISTIALPLVNTWIELYEYQEVDYPFACMYCTD